MKPHKSEGGRRGRVIKVEVKKLAGVRSSRTFCCRRAPSLFTSTGMS